MMTSVLRVAIGALTLAASTPALAQTPPAPQTPPTSTSTTVLVVAQKEPADPSTLAVAVTAVPNDLIRAAGITFISDAAGFSPNTHFTEFTARKLSNPRIRAVGASPANPGVTTYIDGVPQLNANTSSVDLLDVDQIEFVRGPQSTLFGRNAVGGLINISSTRPSMNDWNGGVEVPFGSDSQLGVVANVSGPIKANKLAISGAVAHNKRDGFTTNSVTGNDVDFRSGTSGKAQVLWTPNSTWEARAIVFTERDRDGDYALNDLSLVRSAPFTVGRDFEGHTDRDVTQTSIVVSRKSELMNFTSTTGFVQWKTVDATDLDYTFLPLARRDNTEEASQFTQEVRFGTPAQGPRTAGNYIVLSWQAGALVFTQDYDQLATNSLAAFVLSPFIGFPVVQTTPRAALDDLGVGVYGQGTLSFSNRLDVTFGVRYDHERRDANIVTGFAPFIGTPDTLVDMRKNFSDVSPQVAAAFIVRPGSIVYGNVSRAFKAGGFNPVAIPGSDVFDEEHAWNFEAGIKTSTANKKLSAALAVFSINWEDLQLNLPIPGAPGQFYIDNAGNATSRGFELELTARPSVHFAAIGAVGITRARFDDGTMVGAVDISGNKIPNTPAFTTLFGAQYTNQMAGMQLRARVDVVTTGAFEYNEANTQRQDAYTLANLRLAVEGRHVVFSVWGRNLADTRYVPLAFEFPGSMPSGFLGEPGSPRTWGATLGIRF